MTMAVREILLLGNEKLYRTCSEIKDTDLEKARQVVQDLHDTLMHFRKSVGFGRAIAAPQIDEPYRIIYMNIDGEATAFLNPRMTFDESELFTLWDDCMSFPGLEVRLNRYKSCLIRYKNLNWQDCQMSFTGDLSELLQHEYDHLDGILAVQRALDTKSFRINPEKQNR
jgi:peptide deformylase